MPGNVYICRCRSTYTVALREWKLNKFISIPLSFCVYLGRQRFPDARRLREGRRGNAVRIRDSTRCCMPVMRAGNPEHRTASHSLPLVSLRRKTFESASLPIPGRREAGTSQKTCLCRLWNILLRDYGTESLPHMGDTGTEPDAAGSLE